MDDALEAYTTNQLEDKSNDPQVRRVQKKNNIRMTEKRRLAMAAAAMMARMMTFSSVLVLWFLPSETSSSVGFELVPVPTAIVTRGCDDATVGAVDGPHIDVNMGELVLGEVCQGNKCAAGSSERKSIHACLHLRSACHCQAERPCSLGT